MTSSPPSQQRSSSLPLSLIVNQVTKRLFSSNSAEAAAWWQNWIVMTALPVLGAALWHSLYTTVDISDDEQCLWIRMWLQHQQQQEPKQKQREGLTVLARRFRLLAAYERAGNRFADVDPMTGYRRRAPSSSINRNLATTTNKSTDGGKDDDNTGTAQPPLEFQPARGVKMWTLAFGAPLSIVQNDPRNSGNNNAAPQAYHHGMSLFSSSYRVTVWFTSSSRGIWLTQQLLLEGRKLWLKERAKKTEIWIVGAGGGFSTLTRPSRPLSSVIVEGTIKDQLREDALRFLSSEQWYVSKGIPYRRGYLLHGAPGCGKSSLITALAGELRLPIAVLSLNDKTMDDQQLKMFMSAIPRDSIVLMEDIDCAVPRQDEDVRRSKAGRLSVTLSGLLNALDGVGAQEGRLLFMTTNYVEKLDDALVRPGRVDVKVLLDRATKAGAAELFDQFFASSKEEFSQRVLQQARSDYLELIVDRVHSFADLQGVLMKAKDNPTLIKAGMEELVATTRRASK